jgi:hypothetical protein
VKTPDFQDKLDARLDAYSHQFFLSNICFLPILFDLTFPANTHRRKVRGDTFNSNAASFSVNHSFAWITLTCSSVIYASSFRLTAVSSFARLIVLSRCRNLYNLLAHGSEQVWEVVFRARNSCLQNSQTLTILKLLLMGWGLLFGYFQFSLLVISPVKMYHTVSNRIILYHSVSFSRVIN